MGTELDQNDLDKFEQNFNNASSWNELEKILLCSRESDYFNDLFEPYLSDHNSGGNFSLESSFARHSFVGLVRTLYASLKEEQINPESRILSEKDYLIDGISVNIFGVYHDREGLIQTRGRALDLTNSETLTVFETGFEGPYSLCGKDMNRNDELRYCDFKSRIGHAGFLLSVTAKCIGGDIKNFIMGKQETIARDECATYQTINFTKLPDIFEETFPSYVIDNQNLAESFLELKSYNRKRYDHLSLRSFAQVEYSVNLAKKRGFSNVNLFVGAAHLSDARYIYETPKLRESLLDKFDTKKTKIAYNAFKPLYIANGLPITLAVNVSVAGG